MLPRGVEELFGADGVATTAQLLTVMTRAALANHIQQGRFIRVWHGVYASGPPTVLGQLAALDLIACEPMVACMNTAAALYGFDTEQDERLHVLDPGVRMRPSRKLMVHQRIGAPLRRVDGRLATAPAWTAVELARSVRRPRALAVLDAALRSGSCNPAELRDAIAEQKGRRGIVKVRELIQHADPLAESAMESEARLVFIDGGLPKPELQVVFIDRCGEEWRVDFYWRDARLVGEYDSREWHEKPEALWRDRMKTARLQELGLTVVSIVAEDVRARPFDLVARVFQHLERSDLAG